MKGLRYGEILLAAAVLAACALLLSRWGGDGGSLEKRMEAVLSQVEGAGRVRVLLSRESEGGPATGAVIVAEGARSARVLLELQQAVKALLGLPLESIEVLGMKEAAS